MRTRMIVALALLGLAAQTVMTSVMAAPGGSGNGNGNAFGHGYKGGGQGAATGGGAPLPALGLTILGQAVGAAGLYALWRRKRKT